MKRPIHVLGHNRGWTTLCGKSTDRTRWVVIERADEVTCSECLIFLEGAKMMKARGE